MIRHQCPVCGVLHEVSPVRARFAYGRQLACCCACEAERRRRRRRSYQPAARSRLSTPSENLTNKPAEPVAA